MKRKMALMLSLCMVIAGSGSAYMVKAATIVPQRFSKTGAVVSI